MIQGNSDLILTYNSEDETLCDHSNKILLTLFTFHEVQLWKVQDGSNF